MRDPAQDLSAAIETRRLLEVLRTDRAFLLLNDMIQKQVDELQRSILFIPCTGVDSAWEQEYKKGQLAGKLSWGDVLETAIDNLELDIRNLQGQIEDGGDDRTTGADNERAP